MIEQTNAYFKAWPEPDLMLVFNQDKYLPGDTIYFKAFYRLNPFAANLHDELAEINLINPMGKTIETSLFTISKGNGFSYLALSDTLQPGLYQVKARTNQMRNFNKVFTQVLPVVHTQVIQALPTTKIKIRSEGGCYVQGLVNKLGFNSDYKNRPFEVINQNGSVVLSDTTNAWGTGAFLIQPNDETILSFRWKNDSQFQALPTQEREGIALQMRRTSTTIFIQLERSSKYKLELLTVLVTGRGKIHTSEILRSQINEFTIPLETLPPGINKVSVVNQTGEFLATRDFYIPLQKQAFKLETVKTQLEPRELLDVKFNRTTEMDNMLFRVINCHVFPTGAQPHLAWIKAGFASPYPTDSATISLIDSWLLAETRELPSQEILSPDKNRKPFQPLYVVERNGYVKYAGSTEPVPVGTQVALLLQKMKYSHQTFTNTKDGFISLTIPKLSGSDELFVVAEYKGIRIPVEIEWNELVHDKTEPISFSSLDTIDRYAAYKNDVNRIDISYKAFQNKRFKNEEHEFEVAEDWLGRGDVTVMPDKYIDFETMPELIREVVPSLSVGRTKTDAWVRVGLTARQATDNPLYLIDNYATLDNSKFLTLNPADVKSITIYYAPEKLISTGLLGKQGIVDVKTKKGVEQYLQSESLIVTGTKPVKRFNLSIPKNPTFRSTLYWNPERVDGLFSFQASDDLAKFLIEGFVMTGQDVEYDALQIEVDLKH
ncbi:MAG: hypothetical protein KF856_15620 [Cyclobacteriaceae bacterium]|nr:hypothetical protein [Cyclobacteriaceae bacterium]